MINGIKKLNGNDYAKIPPSAIDIEEQILGGIMVDNSCLPFVVSKLFMDALYSDANRWIYAAMLKLYDNHRPVDMLSVIDQLKKDGNLDILTKNDIVKLTRDVVSTANIEAHCHIVLQKYASREMIRIAGEGLRCAYEDLTDVFDMYDKVDGELMGTQEKILSGAVKDMGFYASQVYDQYESVKQTGVLGIQTLITPLDKIFGGLVSPDLFVVAARPAMGKTSLALSITRNTSVLNDIPCAWFSLEMDGTQLCRRLASIDSGVGHKLIRNGLASREEETKFYKSLDRVARAPIYIEDKVDINIRSIRTRATILKRKHKIKYIVVDYLQLISGTDKNGQNREGQISDISRGLKTLAKELEIPVIAISQLNRKVEDGNDKMPNLSHLRESGAIEQDADEVLFIMRPEEYGMTEPIKIGAMEYQTPNLAIGKCAKNRHGATENFAMWFNGPTMAFSTHGGNQQTQFISKPVQSYYERDESESPF